MFWQEKEEITSLRDEVAYLRRRMDLIEQENNELQKNLLDCITLLLRDHDKLEYLNSDFEYHYTFLHHLEDNGKGGYRPWRPKLDPAREFTILSNRLELKKRAYKTGTNPPVE